MYFKFAKNIRVNAFDLSDLVLEFLGYEEMSMVDGLFTLINFSSIDEPRGHWCRTTVHLAPNYDWFASLVTMILYFQFPQCWLD